MERRPNNPKLRLPGEPVEDPSPAPLAVAPWPVQVLLFALKHPDAVCYLGAVLLLLHLAGILPAFAWRSIPPADATQPAVTEAPP